MSIIRDPKTASASPRVSGASNIGNFSGAYWPSPCTSADVETVVDRVAVAEFLVTAVTLILRCAENRDLEGRISLLIAETLNESFVLGKIVDDQDLDLSALQALRNATENLFDRQLRVVGNDEDEQPFAAEINSIRRGRFQLREMHAEFRARIAPFGRGRR